MYRKCGYCIIVSFLLHCLPVSQPFTERLPAPELTFVELTFTTDLQNGVREAVHLTWNLRNETSASSHTYTLLRKLSSDSLYDVFTSSRGIPADTTNFYDYLYNYQFPETGFDTISYRVVAVDTIGITGDTSAVCVVLLAPQPELVSFDMTSGCLLWESWIRGGVFSWCRVQNASGTRTWTSEKKLEFPLTDKTASFSACVPELTRGTWYYALYVKSNNAYSLTTGVTDVP